jgi:hypothetical protein
MEHGAPRRRKGVSNLWVIYGQLGFPSSGIAKWRAREVDPMRYEESSDGDLDLEVRTVQAILDNRQSELVGASFFDLVEASNTITVRGAVGDDDWAAWQFAFAPMLRVAADEGAVGVIDFASPGDREAERLFIGDGTSYFESAELGRSPALDEVLDEYGRRLAAPRETTPPVDVARAAVSAVNAPAVNAPAVNAAAPEQTLPAANAPQETAPTKKAAKKAPAKKAPAKKAPAKKAPAKKAAKKATKKAPAKKAPAKKAPAKKAPAKKAPAKKKTHAR